jgi:hypothetical protein
MATASEKALRQAEDWKAGWAKIRDSEPAQIVTSVGEVDRMVKW